MVYVTGYPTSVKCYDLTNQPSQRNVFVKALRSKQETRRLGSARMAYRIGLQLRNP